MPSLPTTKTQSADKASDLVHASANESASVMATEDTGLELSPATPAAAYVSLLSAERDGSAPSRASIVRNLQSGYGNDYIQQVLATAVAERPAESTAVEERPPAPAKPTEAPPTPAPEVVVEPASAAPAKPEAEAPAPAPETGVAGAPSTLAAASAAPPEVATEAAAPEAEATPESTEAAAAAPAEAGTPAGAAAEPSGTAAPSAAEVASVEAESEAPKPTGPPAEGAAEAVAQEAPVDGEVKLPAEAQAPASPAEDPAFQAVVAQAKQTAQQQSQHGPAQGKAAEAQAAAKGPANEIQSQAAGAQVDKMGEQEPAPFDRAAFKAALLDKIAAITPKNLEEADEFKEENKAASIKGDVVSQVESGKEGAQGPIQQTTKQAPDPSGAQPKEVVPQPPTEAGPPAADIGGDKAAPKPKTDAEISLEAGSKSLDQKLEENEVTEEQLQHSNEPEFQSAVAKKGEAQADAQAAPTAYRQDEAALVAGAEAGAAATAGTEVASMHGVRGVQFGAIAGDQDTTRTADEQRRAEVAARIEQIYQDTKQKVEARLQQLDAEVNRIFDTGAEQARLQFEAYVDQRMRAYKDERYGGIGGGLLWGKDKLFGMPDEVNVFYQEGRDLYIRLMDAVIDAVATAVETGLNEATALIAEGRKQVQEYVASLPADLQQVGQQAADDIQAKFDSLKDSVDAKRDQLIDALAQKYVDNLKAIDARIDEMKAANRGLVDAALAAIGAIIATIIELKNMLLGVLARVADVVGKIIRDPIGFVGNLVDAVALGLQNFIANLGTHLQKGLMEWLFGALAGAGIQIPDTFDLRGILSLVLQVLGLTYANIRSRAVRILGEEMVSRLEQVAEIFMILVTQGPAGLWEYIKDKIGDLKTMVIEGIKSFVIEKIIVAGITWIVSLLNPASAFIKACKAIYDIIMFFVTRGSQIMALVNAVLDSVSAIASGAIAGAAAAVENALARAIPVVIGFLASLLGLGGISEKIRSIIEKIQAPVNKAIDWVINKAVQLVKAAGKLIAGSGKKDKEEAPETNDPEHDAKVTAGLAAIHQEEKRYLADGKMSREDAEKVVTAVKGRHPVFKSLNVIDGGETWNYDYVASPGESETGGPKEIEVGGIKYHLFQGPGASVRVSYPDYPESLTEIKERAGHAARIAAIVTGLELDEHDANELLSKLPVPPANLEPLLLSFSRKIGRMDPKQFLIGELAKQKVEIRAAVSRPPSRERKATFVTKEPGREVLSEFAIVFHQSPKAPWTDRPHGHKGGAKLPGEDLFKEYVWEGTDDPPIVSHGVVEVDDAGRVVRIVALPPNITSDAKLIELMEAAGWTVAIK